MQTETVTPRGPEFTEEEIERALTALALSSGNSTRAVNLLEHDTALHRVPDDSTLRKWRTTTYADRYREILDQRAPQIEAAAVHDYRAIVAATNQAHLELVDHARDGIDDLTAYEASAAAKNLAIAGGVAADKLLVFTDRPNQITERRDPSEILRALEGIVGTAEEVLDDNDVPLIAESHKDNAREASSPAD